MMAVMRFGVLEHRKMPPKDSKQEGSDWVFNATYTSSTIPPWKTTTSELQQLDQAHEGKMHQPKRNKKRKRNRNRQNKKYVKNRNSFNSCPIEQIKRGSRINS